MAVYAGLISDWKMNLVMHQNRAQISEQIFHLPKFSHGPKSGPRSNALPNSRAEHRVLYKAYRRRRMYGTHTRAGGILATVGGSDGYRMFPYSGRPYTGSIR